jgi:carboxymethylenebutenolidase
MTESQQNTASPSPLPTPKLVDLGTGLRLLHPLSRRGHGPGLVVFSSDESGSGVRLDDGVPSPLMKWAEEGYTVVEIGANAEPENSLSVALAALASCESCVPKEKVGLVGKESFSLYDQ